jgi:glutamate N-acetyltransferase/amino-acid N-acetyltransferase
LISLSESYYKYTMESYSTKEEYMEALEARSRLPEGFRCSTVPITFFPQEKPATVPYNMNLSLIVLDEATPLFGGVFTKNAFPGYPVIMGRQRLKNRSARGVLVNNRVSNVRVEGGMEDAEGLLGRLGGLIGCSGQELFASSTGVIGWRLPTVEMTNALELLVKGLSFGSILPVAQAIMTTDSYPKVRDIEVGEGRILAVGKGAGMIEPNLATMLVFILTDLRITRPVLRKALKWCACETFNRITIDGDQSTSDTVLLFSSGRKPPIAEAEFRQALYSVCWKLAEDVVRNGEGTCHVMKVKVKGASDRETALGAAKAVANSPLVKTAVFGNDPNVGRILNALGDYLGSEDKRIEPASLSIALGGTTVFDQGGFTLNPEIELTLNRYLAECSLNPSDRGFPEHNRTVDIDITLGEGKGEATVLGSDLSYGYVKENAEYRS